MMTLLTTFVFSASVLLVIGLTALMLVRCPRRRRFVAEEAATVTGACGDTMMLQFSVKKGRIVDTAFKSKGCAKQVIRRHKWSERKRSAIKRKG